MNPRTIILSLAVVLGLLLLTFGRRSGPEDPFGERDDKSFEERLKAHPTKLTVRGPAPSKAAGSNQMLPLPPAAEEITYKSGDLELKALFSFPLTRREETCPGLVYIHGLFGLTTDDWRNVEAFRAAGIAVLAPAFRGENGNPGEFEFMRGEVDDLRAAVRWLTARRPVDPNRVYVFGQSVGGGMAALLSLYDEPRVRLTASAGGLFSDRNVEDWRKMQGWIPFDEKDEEWRARLFMRNLSVMKKPHLAIVGENDPLTADASAMIREHTALHPHPLLEILPVSGDHNSSIEPAKKALLDRIAQDTARDKGAAGQGKPASGEAPIAGQRTPPADQEKPR